MATTTILNSSQQITEVIEDALVSNWFPCTLRRSTQVEGSKLGEYLRNIRAQLIAAKHGAKTVVEIDMSGNGMKSLMMEVMCSLICCQGFLICGCRTTSGGSVVCCNRRMQCCSNITLHDWLHWGTSCLKWALEL